MRKLNSYGVPIFTEHERSLLHAEMVNRPCSVCNAVIGQLCVGMRAGQVHMGRLPVGFDTENVVDAALRKQGR